MEIETGRGRGRGRGAISSDFEERTDLRRPHSNTLPPEVSVGTVHENRSNPSIIQANTSTLASNYISPCGNNSHIERNIEIMNNSNLAYGLEAYSQSTSLTGVNHGMHPLNSNSLNSYQAFNSTAQTISDISMVRPIIVQTQTSESVSYQNQKQIPHSQNLLAGGAGSRPSRMMFPSSVPEQLSNELATMSLSSNNLTMPKINSTLSADAPEFIPRFPAFTAQPTQAAPVHSPHMPVSHQTAVLHANMSPHVGGQGLTQPPAPQFQYLSHPVILQVNDIVVNLTMKPHKYEQIANQMTSILSWQVKEVNLMKEIISVIFEQGVGEANFRFNGGRLCQHLSKHVTQSYNGPTFKALLLQKCQEEYNYREYYLQTEPSRLCGFTLFLADIFTHLVTPSAQPLDKLREGICSLLITLMSNPSNLNLKCVSQVLKGSGNALDAGGGDEMETVMCRLKDVAMTPRVPPNICSLLLSVVELRAANWGRGPESDGTSTPSTAPDVPHLGTVYYGPGGVIQRVEDENEDSASDTDDSYYGLPSQGDELEGEVAQAFEEFLRSQPQH